MNITDYFPDYEEIGYTKKSYGVNGHLRVFIMEAFQSSFEKSRHCFFLLKGCLVPYFIEDQEDGIVKFESCESPEDAKSIVSKSIYLKKDQIIISKEKPEVDGFKVVIGFEMLDAETEEVVGTIADVVEYPQQEMAVVTTADGGEYLIPLNFENVKGIDVEEKLVSVEIPDGLLDL